MFAKSHRCRSTAIFVLLGWIFSLVVSSAYGCTPSDTAHRLGSVTTTTHAGDIGHAASDGNAGGATDPCTVACDLQVSPAVKEASGNAPHMDFVALYTSAYVLALGLPPMREPNKPRNAALLYTHSQSLRATRLTL